MSALRKNAKEQRDEARVQLKQAKFHLEFISSKLDKAIDLCEINSLMRKELIGIKKLL